MKRNSLFPASGYKSLFLSYYAVVCLSLVNFLWILTFGSGSELDMGELSSPYADWSFDSYEYVRAGDIIMSGHPDLVRPPVYPMIIYGLRLIVGPVYSVLVLTFVQFLIFVLSGAVLSRIAGRYLKDAKTAFWITAVYLLKPGLVGNCTYILTESLSTSGVIFLIWFMVRRLPASPTTADSLLMGVTMLLLLFLRSVFICFFPAMAIYYALLIYRNIKVKHSLKGPVIGLAMLAMAGLCQLGYRGLMIKEYGVHTTTYASVINNFCTACKAVGYHPELAETPELRALLEDLQEKDYGWIHSISYRASLYAVDHPAEFEQYVDRLIALSPKDYVHRIWFRLRVEVPPLKLVEVLPHTPYNYFDSALTPTFSIYWILMGWIGILWLRQIWLTRKVPVETMLFLMLSLSLTFTTIIGAMAEWTRLTMPAVPILFLLIGRLCTFYRLRYLTQNHQE